MVLGAILACFVLASLCWLALWGGLWGTCLCSALKISNGDCFYVPEHMCVVVVFRDDMRVE